jgi:hypothetical protein
MPLRRRGLRNSAASALSRRVRRMYATAGGLSIEGPRAVWALTQGLSRVKKSAGQAARAIAAEVMETRVRSLADGVRRVIQFLVQHTLLVGGETAAVLRSHVVRFLTNHFEAMVQSSALRRRVSTLIHVIVDPAAKIIDTAFDLMQTPVFDLLRAGARCRCGLLNDAGGEGTEQGARGDCVGDTRHGLSGSRYR